MYVATKRPSDDKNIPSLPDRAMIGFTEVQPIGAGGLSYIPALLKIGTDVHINNVDSPLSTRIVRADADGRSFCEDVPTIIPFVDSIIAIDSTLDLLEDSSALIKEDPILYRDSIAIKRV